MGFHITIPHYVVLRCHTSLMWAYDAIVIDHTYITH